ncbi:helix-turn-helix domain-containing protein [uncultured Desulfovibrio sp.]|uniref:helix-turn-helix domain-containing protein n=1 Tax=uncultured Desulfovibrio sp. TaxID=167968 RepID=UPI002673D960|nr:helix-turn-helix domain-containing protein [uncultured Desulfovibrio sp.]
METFIPRGRITGPILPSFVLREKLSPGAKMLYALLCNHASDKDHCWPSHKFLAQEMGYSVSSIKNWLGELTSARLLTIHRTAYRSSTYVLLRPRAGAASGISSAPARGQSNFGYPQANFGYRNNSRKNLEKLPPLPPKNRATPSRATPARVKRGGGDFLSANSIFERLWAVYPRKEAKELARSAWHRLWRHGEVPALDVLLGALDRFRASVSWNKEHGRFVPQLVNWLRGRRWLDEAPEAPASPVGEQATTPEKTEQVQRCMKRLEDQRRADPALEAARPAFEAFLSRFADGQRKRGPAWGLWSLLHRQGKAPHAGEADTAMGILDFLKDCSFRPMKEAVA